MAGHAQTNCISEAEHRPCTKSESKQLQDHICREEPAPTNLFVAHPVRFTGTFYDQTGAPIDFDSLEAGSHTIVQIRRRTSGEVLFAVPLHSNGEFDFESVPEGEYRLILVWLKNGKFRRLPLADQPKEIRCQDLNECRIRSTITFHGTDDPIDFCPPK
jgi:hypothetical protein